MQLTTAAVVSSGLLIGLFLINASVALSAAFCLVRYMCFSCYYTKGIKITIRRLHDPPNSNKHFKRGWELSETCFSMGVNPLISKFIKLLIVLNAKFKQKYFSRVFPSLRAGGSGYGINPFLGGLLVIQRGSGSSVIPLLGALALGAQRLCQPHNKYTVIGQS